jgi:hypothetical protein
MQMYPQKPFLNPKAISTDLISIKETFFNEFTMVMTPPLFEQESKEYGACNFTLNNLNILYRTAKITPTKIGQFVTLWKRKENRAIQPFESTDPIDLVFISVKKDSSFGLFIFTRSILIEKGIITHLNKEGKRGFRVYPPWDKTISNQAQKTQKWQLNCFTAINKNRFSNLHLIKQYLISQKTETNEIIF